MGSACFKIQLQPSCSVGSWLAFASVAVPVSQGTVSKGLTGSIAQDGPIEINKLLSDKRWAEAIRDETVGTTVAFKNSIDRLNHRVILRKIKCVDGTMKLSGKDVALRNDGFRPHEQRLCRGETEILLSAGEDVRTRVFEDRSHL